MRRSCLNRRQDRGLTLVEILITIAIMSIVIVSVLVALRVSTVGSRIDKDQANIYSWLQDASDRIYQAPRVSCTNGRAAVISAYNIEANMATRPAGWPPSTTIEVTNVQFLGRATSDGVFEWGDAYCFEGGVYTVSPFFTQKVTIRATGPSGEMTKTLEMIKSEN